MIRLLPILLLVAAFDPLSVVKTSSVVSDPQANLLPRRVSGAFVDYTTTIGNPNGVLTAVNGLTFTDAIPANTALRVADIAVLAPGPVDVAVGISLLTYTL